MKSCKILICLIALVCLLAQACAVEESISEDTYSDPALNQMKKQVLEEKKTDTGSYKGQPWATSSLNDSSKKASNGVETSGVQIASGQVQSPNYAARTDSFFRSLINNNFYIVSVAELLNKAAANANWVIVDIRPAGLYSTGHIQGAVNIPSADLISLMGTIPGQKRVAVYGAADTDAAFAVEALRVLGNLDAYVLSGGLSAWQAAGNPVVT